MQALAALLFVPLMLLNILGGIVAVVWLGILGEWSALGVALAATIFGALICSLALMPGLLATAPAILMHERGGTARIASYPLMFLGLLWTFAVMCAWALWWFFYYLQRADSSSFIPMLLVAFSVATAPWGYMAQKEAQSGDSQSTFTTFFLQLACAAIFVMLVFVRASPFTTLMVFIVIMGIALIMNVGIAFAMAASERTVDRIRLREEPTISESTDDDSLNEKEIAEIASRMVNESGNYVTIGENIANDCMENGLLEGEIVRLAEIEQFIRTRHTYNTNAVQHGFKRRMLSFVESGEVINVKTDNGDIVFVHEKHKDKYFRDT